MLALLVALDSFSDKYDIAVLTCPARNSVDFLTESPFGIWCFFSLSSFSLANFFNFQQRSVTWVSVLQWVQYIVPDSVFVFLPLFVAHFSDFANLDFCCLCGHGHCRHALCWGRFISFDALTFADKPCLIITCGKVIPQIKGFPPMGRHSEFQDIE
jgi:hypothetical protein